MCDEKESWACNSPGLSRNLLASLQPAQSGCKGHNTLGLLERNSINDCLYRCCKIWIAHSLPVGSKELSSMPVQVPHLAKQLSSGSCKLHRIVNAHRFPVHGR